MILNQKKVESMWFHVLHVSESDYYLRNIVIFDLL